MSIFPPRLARSLAGLVLACALLGGCDSRDARARDAYAKYQSAAAANDMVGAQQALLQLVSIEDRVAQYWMELGRIQAASGNPGEAYHSLTRAYELDRSNVDLLRILTEFALRGGDPAKAKEYARELEVVAPGDPWVKLTMGHAALRETRFDEAMKEADAVLVTSPMDSQAKVLKARALLGMKQDATAEALLAEQIRAQPSDAMSLQLLANIYEVRSDWPRLLPITRRMAELQPANASFSIMAIETAFKAKQPAIGRADSIKLIKTGANAPLIAKLLDVWLVHWPSTQRATDAFDLGLAARDPKARVTYADFLNRVGRPAEALKLVAGLDRQPVNAESANANAAAAEALGLTGQHGAAVKRFGDVLAYDPGNAMALRGQSKLLLRMGRPKDAIVGAEKLVTVAPEMADDRLLLARVFVAAGDPAQAQRTLWDAFRDIPGNERIYGALAQLTRANPDQRVTLQQEFARQTATKIGQGLL